MAAFLPVKIGLSVNLKCCLKKTDILVGPLNKTPSARFIQWDLLALRVCFFRTMCFIMSPAIVYKKFTENLADEN